MGTSCRRGRVRRQQLPIFHCRRRPAPVIPSDKPVAAARCAAPRVCALPTIQGPPPQPAWWKFEARIRRVRTMSWDEIFVLIDAAANRRPRRLRRAGAAFPAGRLRGRPGAPARSERGDGADAGGLHPRHDEDRPAARSALLRRLAAADHGPHGHQPRHPQGPGPGRRAGGLAERRRATMSARSTR